MRVLSLFLLLCVLPVVGQAQTPGTLAETIGGRYRVTLVDGTLITGTLVAATATEVIFESTGGIRTTIPRSQIRSMVLATGAFMRGDPNSTRLLLFPTARSLEAGTGRFGTYFIFPTIAYGATDWLDFSAGSTIPIEDFFLINLNVKATPIQTERMSLAVGASALIPLLDDEDGMGGTFYGMGTFGTPEQAFTIGALGVYGTSFEDDDFLVADGGALVLGFEKQVSNSVKFMTENYVIISDGVEGAILSAGVRFFGEKLSADIAPFVAVGDGDVQFSPVPYFTFSYAFGR